MEAVGRVAQRVSARDAPPPSTAWWRGRGQLCQRPSPYSLAQTVDCRWERRRVLVLGAGRRSVKPGAHRPADGLLARLRWRAKSCVERASGALAQALMGDGYLVSPGRVTTRPGDTR